MEKKSFTVQIDAPREKVWDSLWNENTYSEWTAPFCEGSVAKTDWKEGSKVFFVDANGAGMVSTIAKKTPDSFMSFHHLGPVKNGVEDFSSQEGSACSGGYENYILESIDGRTNLRVEIDLPKGMEDYLLKTWPLALDRLKSISESR